MLTLAKLAFRNVFRFKRRTFITLSAVSIGLALLIISISLLNGIDKQSISNIINCQTSHIKIFKKGYFDKKDELPLNIRIEDPTPVHEKLAGLKGIRASENRILFGAGLIKDMDELPCLGVAIDVEKDPEIFNIKESLVQGQWLDPKKSQMLVGKDLAKDIGLTVGDRVTVRMVTSSEDEDFSWNALDLEISGIFDSGNPGVDSQRLFIPMAIAREGLSMEKAVTEIVVRLESGDEKFVDRMKKEIGQILVSEGEDLEAFSWKDLAGTFLLISKMKSKNSAMIIMIMLFIASMGIINTMLMAVMERTREIGMLAAMGMKKKEITRLFVLEGSFIGAIGAFLGCFLGGMAGWYLETKGWSIKAMGESLQDLTSAFYPVKEVFYADITFELLLMTFLFGIAIAVLAALYPARKAAKMNPIRALRHI